ncbi:hypothetical protein CesoFtcFv8_027220 [Champsocephalus esox]|uniref:Uncharacterized protein n=1 Tax=Champsocephalus esox TaxID=159716 RepID=A0AAN8B0N7_9TELE|nr:hypothetical protein CesoFtcFv8_027220 [Champsocephalus esox]
MSSVRFPSRRSRCPREPHANRLKSQPDIYGLQLRMGMNPHADRDGYQEEADRAETKGLRRGCDSRGAGPLLTSGDLMISCRTVFNCTLLLTMASG